MQGGRSLVSTRLLTDSPEGPGKDWSCIIQNFRIRSPCSLRVSCSTMPMEAMELFGMECVRAIGRGRA